MQPSAPDKKMVGSKAFSWEILPGTEWTTPSKTKHYLFLCIYLKMYFAPNTKLNFTIMSDIATKSKENNC